MKKLALLAVLFPLCAAAQSASVTWVGHACFIVQGSDNTTVVTDPPAPAVGYSVPKVSATAVTISHNHGDHNDTSGIAGNFTLVDGRQATERREVSAGPLKFVVIPGFHDNQQGAKRGPNAIICWSQSGLSFAHMGDFGQDDLTPAQLKDLGKVDVLFIPAGGFFTIDGDRAAAIIRTLNPKVAVLMHYKTELGGPAQLANRTSLAKTFPNAQPMQGTVEIKRSTLPAATEVWLMQPR